MTQSGRSMSFSRWQELVVTELAPAHHSRENSQRSLTTHRFTLTFLSRSSLWVSRVLRKKSRTLSFYLCKNVFICINTVPIWIRIKAHTHPAMATFHCEPMQMIKCVRLDMTPFPFVMVLCKWHIKSPRTINLWPQHFLRHVAALLFILQFALLWFIFLSV